MVNLSSDITVFYFYSTSLLFLGVPQETNRAKLCLFERGIECVKQLAGNYVHYRPTSQIYRVVAGPETCRKQNYSGWKMHWSK